MLALLLNIFFNSLNMSLIMLAPPYAVYFYDGKIIKRKLLNERVNHTGRMPVRGNDEKLYNQYIFFLIVVNQIALSHQDQHVEDQQYRKSRINRETGEPFGMDCGKWDVEEENEVAAV